MKKKFTEIISAFGSGLILFSAIATPVAFAQAGGQVSNSGATSTSSGDSLKISPLRTDVVARPGELKKVVVYVQNLTTRPITLKPINNDFIAGSKEDGSPSIILDEKEYAPTHSLKRFMQPLPNFAVAPGERKAIGVTINVPSDAQSGGYYGAIRFAPALADGSQSVNVSGSVASLILLTVPGNLVENLTLKTFDVQQKGQSSLRFSTPDNLAVLLRLENKGNVQVAPFGDLLVQKGDKTIYKTEINNTDPKGLVLPDSVRKFNLPIKNLQKFGKYKITASVGYGGNGQTITTQKEIWIIPTIYIIGAIAAIVGLIVLFTLIFIALRAYKNRILRGSRRRRY